MLLSNPARLDHPERFDPNGPEWTWREIGEDLVASSQLADAIVRALASPGAQAEEHLSDHIADLPRAT